MLFDPQCNLMAVCRVFVLYMSGCMTCCGFDRRSILRGIIEFSRGHLLEVAAHKAQKKYYKFSVLRDGLVARVAFRLISRLGKSASHLRVIRVPL